jgi:apolipoprotein N-acyltransferase
MHIYGDIPEVISFGILVLFALYLGLYHALFAAIFALLRDRLSVRTALILSPFVWVAVELARARVTGFPWDLLGYTQVENALLTQLAPIGGVMLLSFAIAGINALLALSFAGAKLRRPWQWAIVGLALAVAWQAGCFLYAPPDPAAHHAVLLQENLAVGASGAERTTLPVLEKYRQFGWWSQHPQTPASSLNASVSKSPDLIVWPEAPAGFFTTDPIFLGELGPFARSVGAPLIVGSSGIENDSTIARGYRYYGSAAIFNPQGEYVGRYDKIHLVPFGEYVPYKNLFFFAGKLTAGSGDTTPGTERKVFNLGGHPTGIFICYESIFGDEIRRFVLNGAQVLVNISDDGWYGDTSAPWQHLDMARMRAIENDRWVLRDTNTGITTAIDPHGRGYFLTPRHVRAAFDFSYDYRTNLTFYTRHGDWFAWLCAMVVLAFAVMAARTPRLEPVVTSQLR